jgi:hypothetical protein
MNLVFSLLDPKPTPEPQYASEDAAVAAALEKEVKADRNRPVDEQRGLGS